MAFKYLMPALAVQFILKAQPVRRLISLVPVAHPWGTGSPAEIEVLAVEILFWNKASAESDEITLMQSVKKIKGEKKASEAEEALKKTKL